MVSEPMDLSTVWNKLNTLQYESAESFAADIRLMFRNCDAYNLVRHLSYLSWNVLCF